MFGKISKFFAIFSMLFTAGFFATMLVQYVARQTQIETPVHHVSQTNAPPLSPGTAPKLTPLSSTSTASGAAIKQENAKNTITQKKIVATTKPSTSSKVSMPGALIVPKSAATPSPAPTPAPVPEPAPTPATPSSASYAGTPSSSGDLNQHDIFIIVNKERAAVGLPALTYNNRLSAIAEIKAVDMINKQYFAHVAPDGTDIAALAKHYGYAYINLGENLAEGDFGSSAEVMTGWMNSPGHKANILNKNYTEVGISAVQGNYEGHYVWFAVQEFGRPMDACPAIDQTLKVSIDAEEATLNQDEVQLAAYKSELASGNLSHDEYNQIVAEYNALVDEYNALVGKTKQDVAIFNDEVNVFNTCVGS